MAESFPIPFGRYQLIERLAIGGMAELFIATSPGEHGFEKKVVIKRLLPHLNLDPTYNAMFVDEAKLTARLVHPKIAQTFELAREGDMLFIAMEYVEGIDVLALLRECAQQRRRIDPALAAWICHEVLDALDYAHHLVDDAGTSFNIVHRDISPSNVLLSSRGDVKLVDFGIARAADPQRSHKTKSGTLKGKYGYMSPEQVIEQPLDQRSDLFSVGVVLAELLTGRRLFAAANELDVLLMVRDARLTRLDKYGSDLDPALQELVRKALRKNPDDRWSSAAEFRDAINEWLFETRNRVTAKTVGDFVSEIKEAMAMRRSEAAAMDAIETAVLDEALPPAMIVDKPPPRQYSRAPSQADGIPIVLESGVELGGDSMPVVSVSYDESRGQRAPSEIDLSMVDSAPIALPVTSRHRRPDPVEVRLAQAEAAANALLARDVSGSVVVAPPPVQVASGTHVSAPATSPPPYRGEPIMPGEGRGHLRGVAPAGHLARGEMGDRALDHALDHALDRAIDQAREPLDVRSARRAGPRGETFNARGPARPAPSGEPDELDDALEALDELEAPDAPAAGHQGGRDERAARADRGAARSSSLSSLSSMSAQRAEPAAPPPAEGRSHTRSSSLGAARGEPSEPAAPAQGRSNTPPAMIHSTPPRPEPTTAGEPRGHLRGLAWGDASEAPYTPPAPPSTGRSNTRNSLATPESREPRPVMSAAAQAAPTAPIPTLTGTFGSTGAPGSLPPRPGAGTRTAMTPPTSAPPLDATAYPSIAAAMGAIVPMEPDPSSRDFDGKTVHPGRRSADLAMPSPDELARKRPPTPPPLGDIQDNPDDSGDFSVISPLRVLFRLMLARSTGLLVVAIGGIKKEVYVRDGQPEYVSSNVASELFGSYLVTKGVLSDGELAMALAMMPHYGGRLGDTLVGLGLLKPLEVFRHLTRQVRTKLIDVCTWNKGTFAWYANRENAREAFPLDFNAFEILGAGAMALPDDVVDAWLARNSHARLRAVKQRRLGPDRFEVKGLLELFDFLDGRRTVGDLVELQPDRSERLRVGRMLCLLEACDMAKA